MKLTINGEMSRWLRNQRLVGGFLVLRRLSCQCRPEGYLRKVFILVANRVTPEVWLRRLFGDLPKGY